MSGLLDKAARIARKNWPEFKAFTFGEMPAFVYGRKKFRDIPVFCFHEAILPDFEEQLRFLTENGYRTLDGASLLKRLSDPTYRNDGKDIVLTFDDALTSVWTTGLPLLRKYDCKIMLFVIVDLVPDRNELRPHVDGETSEDDVSSTYPLCNWAELAEMHKSGHVDIQSHGLVHTLVSTGPRVVDFVSPMFDPYYYENIHVPIYENAAGEQVRDPEFGHPVYEHHSRLDKHPRYIDSPQVRRACQKYVSENGGRDFFRDPDWRSRLGAVHQQALRQASIDNPAFESREDRLRELRRELGDSRRALQARFPGKPIEHFCFPWFIGSKDAYRIAGEEGYAAVHVGATPNFPVSRSSSPVVVRRLEQEFLLSLPGAGSRSLASVLKAKLKLRRQSAENSQARVRDN